MIGIQELVFSSGKSADFVLPSSGLYQNTVELGRQKNQGIRGANLGDFSPTMQIWVF
jgi:hypothetical protein